MFVICSSLSRKVSSVFHKFSFSTLSLATSSSFYSIIYWSSCLLFSSELLIGHISICSSISSSLSIQSHPWSLFTQYTNTSSSKDLIRTAAVISYSSKVHFPPQFSHWIRIHSKQMYGQCGMFPHEFQIMFWMGLGSTASSMYGRTAPSTSAARASVHSLARTRNLSCISHRSSPISPT